MGASTIGMDVMVNAQLLEMIKTPHMSYPLTRAAFRQFSEIGKAYAAVMPMALPKRTFGSKASLGAKARSRLKKLTAKDMLKYSKNGNVSEGVDIDII